MLGLEDGQDEVDDCLESEHDEEDEVDEKRRKVSKVSLLYHFFDIKNILPENKLSNTTSSFQYIVSKGNVHKKHLIQHYQMQHCYRLITKNIFA